MIDIDGRRLPVPRDEYFGVHRQAERASEHWLDLTQAMVARATRRLLRLSETPIPWWSTLITLCVVLLAPLAVVDVPPLLDYPNHLARAYVLAHGQQDAHLDIRLLSAPSPDPRDLETFPLEGQWSCCYDYVLLLEAAARPDFSHDNLELLRQSAYASLFRIRQHAPWVEPLSRRIPNDFTAAQIDATPAARGDQVP